MLTVCNPRHSQSRSRGTDELANMRSDELFAEARASAGSGGVTLLPARVLTSVVMRGSRWLAVQCWRKRTMMTGKNKSRGEDVGVPTDQFAIPFLPLTRHDAVNKASI